MKVERYGGQGWQANCYLVLDDAETTAVLVDPSIPPTALLARRATLPPLSLIILTHAHFDHMLYADAWRKATGAPLAIHEGEAAALTDPTKNAYLLFGVNECDIRPADRYLRSGEAIALGAEKLTVLHTPGHTGGSICLLGDGLLLSGDTLFARSIGRTDLPGGSDAEMAASLRLLGHITGNPRVLAGHGPETTLDDEKENNPYWGME